MPKPLPWSHSALEDFVNCPRAYYEKRVAKSVKDEGGPALDEGNRVHKAFELRIRDGLRLPDDLQQHEVTMQWLEGLKGERWAERRIALDTKVQPCDFFAKNTWMRGVIDFTNVYKNRARIVDYKTGKKKSKFRQLELNALWIFAEYPEVDKVQCAYYWTKEPEGKRFDAREYTRDMIDKLWAGVTPDLGQYVEAFKTDTWQPRQSGLCRGWCPVTQCEFWSPKRVY